MNKKEKVSKSDKAMPSRLERIVSTKTGKLLSILDHDSGDTLTGDIWRLAMQTRDYLDMRIISMRMDIQSLELNHKHLDNAIKRMEKKWDENR